MRFVTLIILAAPLMAQTPEECRKEEHSGRRAQANQCFEKLVASPKASNKAEGLWGLHHYKDANEAFRSAVAGAPKNAEYRIHWGRMFLEQYNPKDAAGLFSEALEIDPKNAQATLGLALVASDGFDNKAVELAHKAIELDPKLTEAQELLASLALEDNT